MNVFHTAVVESLTVLRPPAGSSPSNVSFGVRTASNTV